MQEGTLVPTETVVDILFQATNSRRDVGHAVIVDGFPRTVEQALYAEKLVCYFSSSLRFGLGKGGSTS